MFEKRLNQLIAEKGISKYQIAKETKITEATLSNYTKGKVSPSPSIVQQLSLYFDVDYNWLMFGNGKKYNTYSTQISDSGVIYSSALNAAKMESEALQTIDYLKKQIKVKDELIKHLMTVLDEKINLLLQQKK